MYVLRHDVAAFYATALWLVDVVTSLLANSSERQEEGEAGLSEDILSGLPRAIVGWGETRPVIATALAWSLRTHTYTEQKQPQVQTDPPHSIIHPNSHDTPVKSHH